jgi:hypothetical protein
LTWLYERTRLGFDGDLMTRSVLTVGWVAALGQLGCGSAAVPQEQLTAAQAAVKGAEVAGAPSDPKAALHLKLAKEQVEKAQALIADGENEDAARLIERAQADADLALLLAREARGKQEAASVQEQIEEIKRRMNK